MEAQYEIDLANATEIVLKLPRRQRRTNVGVPAPESDAAAEAFDSSSRASGPPPRPSAPPENPRRGPPYPRARGGSSGRAAAGAMRIANSVGAAIANRRVLGRSETSLLVIGGVVLVACAIVGFFWPRVVAWPLAALALWVGASLFVQCIGTKPEEPSPPPGETPRGE
jgi:cardiolipin synthase